MNNIIEFENVSKSFGDLKVLNNLNLQVKDGEKLALIGPSGSGKTTILRILMTLENIDDGFVIVNGEYLWHEKVNENIVSASEKHLHKMRDQIGMVFQQFNLFPHLSAIENVQQPQILIKQKTKSEAKEKAGELFNLVGLGDKLNHYPHQLSGGQQQRVAIARALAMDPKIMLFDEITSALDPELVDEVLTVFAGHLSLHVNGEVHDLGVGDCIWLPDGTELIYEAESALIHFAIHPVNWQSVT